MSFAYDDDDDEDDDAAYYKQQVGEDAEEGTFAQQERQQKSKAQAADDEQARVERLLLQGSDMAKKDRTGQYKEGKEGKQGKAGAAAAARAHPFANPHKVAREEKRRLSQKAKLARKLKVRPDPICLAFANNRCCGSVGASSGFWLLGRSLHIPRVSRVFPAGLRVAVARRRRRRRRRKRRHRAMAAAAGVIVRAWIRPAKAAAGREVIRGILASRGGTARGERAAGRAAGRDGEGGGKVGTCFDCTAVGLRPFPPRARALGVRAKQSHTLRG